MRVNVVGLKGRTSGPWGQGVDTPVMDTVWGWCAWDTAVNGTVSHRTPANTKFKPDRKERRCGEKE